MRTRRLNLLWKAMQGASAPPPAPGEDPLNIFTAFDRAEVPSHVGAGAHGVQRTIPQWNLPVTTVEVSVANLTQLGAALISGRRITLTANIGPASASGFHSFNQSFDDVEINLNGFVLKNIVFGGGSTTTRRCRITGPTPGTYTGLSGQAHGLAFSGYKEDIIFDAVGMSGDELNWGEAVQFHDDECLRFAVVNCVAFTGTCGFLGEVNHAFFGGNNIITGDLPDPGGGNRTAWGLRMLARGYVILVDSDIRGNRFHRIRIHPIDNTCIVYIARTTFVDLVESRIIWVNAFAGGMTGVAQAVWIVDNDFYTSAGILSIDTAHGGPGSTGEIGGDNFSSATYVRFNNNRVRGPFDIDDVSIDNPGATDTDKTGNTFSALTTVPGFAAPGDPSTLLEWDSM